MEEFISADVPAGIAHIAGLRANLPVDGGQQEEAKGTVPGDVTTFKDLLDSCIKLFQSLIEDLLQASKLSEYYFLHIIRRIDDELVRLEIWASDIGVQDPEFGRSSNVAPSKLELTVYMIGILESIISSLNGVRDIVQTMRDSLERLAGSSSADPCSSKRTRQLDKLSKAIEVEHQLIVTAIRRLIDLTEAFKLELANCLQSGPLAERRAQILKMREDVLRKAEPQSTTTTERSSLSSQGDPEPSALDRDAHDTEQQDPWRTQSLLTFDDGGTKNYASLLLLKALIEEIATLEQSTAISSADPLPLEPGNRRRQNFAIPEERGGLAARFLPCHYFDYIAGTGFGGIIAIMLGRLRMTVNECIEAYLTLLDEAWSHPRKNYIFGPGLGGKYDPKRISDCLKKIVEGTKLGTMYPQSNEDLCRTIVTALSKDYIAPLRQSYIFRSYHHPAPAGGEREVRSIVQKPRPPDDYPIWQVGRAATAGTDYFARMKRAEMDYRQVELSASFNDWSLMLETFNESLPPLTYDPKAVRVIVCISSGHWERKSRFLSNASSLRPVKKRLPNRMGEEESHIKYFRLKAEETVIGTVPPDTWKGERGSKTLGLIREKIEAYLSSQDAQALISDAAGELVTMRQARSKWQPDLDRWKRFCHGVEYNCPISQCKQKTQTFVERQELRRHLERVHRSDTHTMETLLDKGERFPLYD